MYTHAQVLLLKQMNEEKVMLQQIARPLKDFNENRLSTFEIALLVKLVPLYNYGVATVSRIH